MKRPSSHVENLFQVFNAAVLLMKFLEKLILYSFPNNLSSCAIKRLDFEFFHVVVLTNWFCDIFKFYISKYIIRADIHLQLAMRRVRV